MKSSIRWILIALTSLTLLGNVSTAFAQEDNPPQGRRGGVRGEVTAVSDTTLTVAARNGQSVTVNVTDETKILLLASDGEGGLADIQVGDWIGVRGSKSEDGSLQARLIAVLPKDLKELDKIRGKVTAIEGDVIVIENRQGSQRITTNAETKFRIGQEDGSLADITADNFVLALGEKEDDSFVARVVVAVTKEQLRKQVLRVRGEVTAIDRTTFTLQTPRRGELTVLTDESTQYLTLSGEEVSFDDIEVGAKVIVAGKPVEDQEKTLQAVLIGLRPAAEQN